MAGAGAKKRLEENKRHINILRCWLAAGFITFFSVRLLVFGSTASTWHWIGFALTTLINYACFSGISALAAPIYGERGELLDGGADMGMKGFNAYYHDVLYITSFVQCGASFYNWFWYAYLLVPAYGLYKLMQKVVIPWAMSSGSQKEPIMDEETRKKMERAEKRARARAQKWR